MQPSIKNSPFSSRQALRIYGIAALALLLVCTVLETVLRLFFFDHKIGYYENGALPVIFEILCVLFVVAAAVFCFVPKVRLSFEEQTHTVPVRVGAAFLAASFLFSTTNSLITLYTVISNDLIILTPFFIFSSVTPIVFSAFACFGFLRMTALKESGGVMNVIACVFAIYIYALDILNTYFDPNMAMNSPIKILLHLASISFILLLVNEARVGLGYTKRYFHAFSAALSTLFCGVFAISECFIFPELGIDHVYSAEYVMNISARFLIAPFIFSLMRLISICFIKQTPETAETEAAETEAETEAAEAEATETEAIEAEAEATETEAEVAENTGDTTATN